MSVDVLREITWYCLDSPLWGGGFLDLRQKLEQIFITQTIPLLTHKQQHKNTQTWKNTCTVRHIISLCLEDKCYSWL